MAEATALLVERELGEAEPLAVQVLLHLLLHLLVLHCRHGEPTRASGKPYGLGLGFGERGRLRAEERKAETTERRDKWFWGFLFLWACYPLSPRLMGFALTDVSKKLNGAEISLGYSCGTNDWWVSAG
jgi:hypothetical protein